MSLSQINELLFKASTASPYYMRLISNGSITNPMDLHSYPLLYRDTLQSDASELATVNATKAPSVNRVVSTSGSSGKPIVLTWNLEQYLKSMRTLWMLRKKYYAITPLDRQVNFTLRSDLCYTGEIIYKIDSNNTILSFDRTSMRTTDCTRKVIDIIETFDPAWLYIQPNILHQLINYCENHNLHLSKNLRHIETVGEILTTELRDRVKSQFGLELVNLYGSEEMNGIAYQCPLGHMHIIRDNVIVECVRNGEILDSGKGESVLTNLHNLRTPLIRYAQGDYLEISEITSCGCGYYGKSIRAIEGRIQESILVKERIVSAYMLSDCVSKANTKLFGVITQYSFAYIKCEGLLECTIYTQINSHVRASEIKQQLMAELTIGGVTNMQVKIVICNEARRMNFANKRRILQIVD
jgi:phenylacetate-CoA ligase